MEEMNLARIILDYIRNNKPEYTVCTEWLGRWPDNPRRLEVYRSDNITRWSIFITCTDTTIECRREGASCLIDFHHPTAFVELDEWIEMWWESRKYQTSGTKPNWI